jgi:hypothetical protein
MQRFDIQRFTLGKKAPFFRSMRILTRSALDLRIPQDRHVLASQFRMVDRVVYCWGPWRSKVLKL